MLFAVLWENVLEGLDSVLGATSFPFSFSPVLEYIGSCCTYVFVLAKLGSNNLAISRAQGLCVVYGRTQPVHLNITAAYVGRLVGILDIICSASVPGEGPIPEPPGGPQAEHVQGPKRPRLIER